MKKALGPVTLAYPMPAFLVAAYDEEGKANIMTAAWGGICCSNPPCIAVSLRPERWTHKAIVARRAFTVCVPSAAQAAWWTLRAWSPAPGGTSSRPPA